MNFFQSRQEIGVSRSSTLGEKIDYEGSKMYPLAMELVLLLQKPKEYNERGRNLLTTSEAITTPNGESTSLKRGAYKDFQDVGQRQVQRRVNSLTKDLDLVIRNQTGLNNEGSRRQALQAASCQLNLSPECPSVNPNEGKQAYAAVAEASLSLNRKTVLAVVHDLLQYKSPQELADNPVLVAMSPDRKKRRRLINSAQRDRKVRSDRRDLKFIWSYIHDICRLDTFSKERDVSDPVSEKKIKHRRHELPGTLDFIYRELFLASDEYKNHLEKTGLQISFSLFKRGAYCPCLGKPKKRFCADIVETQMEMYLLAAYSQWKKKVGREYDRLTLKLNTIFCQTDYSAQPQLVSQDGMNCAKHGVCVLQCWIILFKREVKYEDENGMDMSFEFTESHHVRVVSPSTGKQKDQDWYLHCQVLDCLQKYYRDNGIPIFSLTEWTDGAPNQYKCRQHFFHISQSDIKICHRLGGTSQFKGTHDAIGQAGKSVVRDLEKCSRVRCSTAYEFYRALVDNMPPVEDWRTKTIKQMKDKKQMTATKNIFIYAASDEDDAKQVKEGDMNIVLDRSKMWNCSAVTGCQSHYEFRNVHGNDNANLIMSKWACPCANCTEHFNSAVPGQTCKVAGTPLVPEGDNRKEFKMVLNPLAVPAAATVGAGEDAEVEAEDEPEEPVDSSDVYWVECELCTKWRKTSYTMYAQTEGFQCQDNSEHTSGQCCDDPEEFEVI